MPKKTLPQPVVSNVLDRAALLPDDLSLEPIHWVPKGARRNVLDHGFVKLVDYMGGDDAIVQAARVSHGAGTKTKRTDAGLIKYLVKNRHTTPLEMVVIKFHVKLPIFVARQWIRHRMGSFNEVSARYTEMSDEFYIPELDRLHKQDTKNRQGSSTELIDYPVSAQAIIRDSCAQQYEHYQGLLASGLSRELARVVLPVNLYTEWYWKVDLHNLMGFLSLRTDSHAQWEIQRYAEKILELATPIAPVAFGAWEDNRKNWARYADWLATQES